MVCVTETGRFSMRIARVQVFALSNSAFFMALNAPLIPFCRDVARAYWVTCSISSFTGEPIQSASSRRSGLQPSCVGVVVDAKPGPVSFYEQFGFEALEVAEGQSQARPAATAMLLSLREIEAEIE